MRRALVPSKSETRLEQLDVGLFQQGFQPVL
jgi:hypothetical protein